MYELLSIFVVSFGIGAIAALTFFKGYRLRLTLSLWTGVKLDILPPDDGSADK